MLSVLVERRTNSVNLTGTCQVAEDREFVKDFGAEEQVANEGERDDEVEISRVAVVLRAA